VNLTSSGDETPPSFRPFCRFHLKAGTLNSLSDFMGIPHSVRMFHRISLPASPVCLDELSHYTPTWSVMFQRCRTSNLRLISTKFALFSYNFIAIYVDPSKSKTSFHTNTKQLARFYRSACQSVAAGFARNDATAK